MEVENRYRTALFPKTELSSVGEDSIPETASVSYSPELLQLYYSRLFPFDLLHSWLSYGNDKELFSHREFSMTIEPKAGEEVYVRYQSFPTREALANTILQKRPTKIDIGGVYTHPPKDKNTLQINAFQPVQRELVFDIDLTDYDSIRRCGCSGANICKVCWKFMIMAVNVIDETLKKDFGFVHVAWFYSGRRGVHAWVCDKEARELSDEGRSAVANYLQVNLATEKNKNVSLPSPLHPMLVRAYEILEPYFIDNLLAESGHGLLASPESWIAFLNSLPESASEVRDRLLRDWTGDTTPEQKWNELKTHLHSFCKASAKAGSNKSRKNMSSQEFSKLENWKIETVFLNTYPRLDINVSKHRNHLLKSPFCVHPKTGRVCVPFLAEEVQSFDPFSVPTIAQLIHELDSSTMNGIRSQEKSDWRHTSLKRYFESFENRFLLPLQQSLLSKKKDDLEKIAAIAVDF